MKFLKTVLLSLGILLSGAIQAAPQDVLVTTDWLEKT